MADKKFEPICRFLLCVGYCSIFSLLWFSQLNSITKTIKSSSVPIEWNKNVKNLLFTASLLHDQQQRNSLKHSLSGSKWQLDSKAKRSLRCLLAKTTWWIKMQLQRTVFRLVFAVRVLAGWKPTKIIGRFIQLCATLIQWTDWSSTKIKLLIIPLKIMLNSATGAQCNMSLEAVRCQIQLPGFVLRAKCSLNWLIKWSSPICKFIQFWRCFIGTNSAPIIRADFHFPTIQPQGVLTKSFCEIWVYLKLLVDIKLESGEGARLFVSNFFWFSVAAYYPKQLALWRPIYCIKLFKIFASPSN